jgi:hypothetical protein
MNHFLWPGIWLGFLIPYKGPDLADRTLERGILYGGKAPGIQALEGVKENLCPAFWMGSHQIKQALPFAGKGVRPAALPVQKWRQ